MQIDFIFVNVVTDITVWVENKSNEYFLEIMVINQFSFYYSFFNFINFKTVWNAFTEVVR